MKDLINYKKAVDFIPFWMCSYENEKRGIIRFDCDDEETLFIHQFLFSDLLAAFLVFTKREDLKTLGGDDLENEEIIKAMTVLIEYFGGDRMVKMSSNY